MRWAAIAVAKLSSRARPNKRRVSFIYHSDCSDLPGGWESLMKKYYDVMYSESYDWWTLAIAFNTNQKLIKEIKKYRFCEDDDLGLDVDSKDTRIIVTIHCRLSTELMAKNDYPRYDDYEEDDSDETHDNAESLEANDNLLNLLAENRKYLQKGDYRLLYGVWKKYGGDSEEAEEPAGKTPPKPSGMNQLPKPIKQLLSLLEQDE